MQTIMEILVVPINQITAFSKKKYNGIDHLHWNNTLIYADDSICFPSEST